MLPPPLSKVLTTWFNRNAIWSMKKALISWRLLLMVSDVLVALERHVFCRSYATDGPVDLRF